MAVELLSMVMEPPAIRRLLFALCKHSGSLCHEPSLLQYNFGNVMFFGMILCHAQALGHTLFSEAAAFCEVSPCQTFQAS